MIGEAEIPAGSYSLYAIPGPERWELIVNGTTERWGVPLNDQVRSADVDTAIAVVEPASQLVENFTMRFERRSATTVDLVWEWESTLVRVPIRRSDS
jgi:hypothetical protein